MPSKQFAGPLERVNECLWRIPKSYKRGMRVDGLIYADNALMELIRRDDAAEQVANVAFLPGIQRASLAMPDIHWGYGFCIGGGCATDPEGGGGISPGGGGACSSWDPSSCKNAGWRPSAISNSRRAAAVWKAPAPISSATAPSIGGTTSAARSARATTSWRCRWSTPGLLRGRLSRLGWPRRWSA